MRTHWRLSPAATLAVGLLAWPAAQAQEPAAPAHVARLVRNLGSVDFTERQDADRELARLGNEGRAALEAAASSTDPEIRLRAKNLLERLKVRDLWAGAEINFRSADQSASQVLAAFAEQSGNHILTGDQYGTFVEGKLNLTMEQKPYWEAIDDVCRLTGNHLRPHYDVQTPGVVVAAGKPGKHPVAYAGPLRVQITSARRVFVEELDYEDLTSALTHTFQINLQMMWEDRFRLVGYCSQPELVSAVTDSGEQVGATLPSGNSWNVTAAGTRQISANIRLNPPPVKARSLERLTLKWGLVAVGDMATLEVRDVQARRQHHQDDLTLTIESCEKQSGGRYEIALLVARDIAMPDLQDIVFQENLVELIDQDDRPFRLQNQTNTHVERGAELKLSVTGETSASVPKLLRLTYPKLRARKDLEITFRHVPLPSQRPE